MKKLAFTLTVFSLACSFASSVFAETLTAKQSLDKMAESLDKLNYDIAFIQATPANIDSYRYRHIRQDNKTYSQLMKLDGDVREINQQDNLVSYFSQDSSAFAINSGDIVDSLPAVMRANFNRLANNYDFIKFGKDRIAGRIVDTIRVVPKDDFRYQFLLFIDEENGLLLRSDMLDRDGALLEQFRVVTLSINTHHLKGVVDYMNQLNTPPMLSEPKNEVTPARLMWSAGWVPPGFEAIRYNQDVFEDEIFDSVLFGDGLFTFKIFVTKAGSDNLLDDAWKQGALTVYSEVIGDKEITFVGQLPIAAAKRIVQEVKLK